MLLYELFETKKKPSPIKKKLRVKQKRNRKHVPVVAPPELPKRAKKKKPKQLNKK